MIYDNINQELKEVKEKIESIASYDQILTDLLCEGFADFCLILFCVGLAVISIEVICNSLPYLGAILGVVATYLIYCSGIKTLIPKIKELKSLKKKGVKKLKKEEKKLRERGKELENESNIIHEIISEKDELLEFIDFIKKTVDVPFYQADTKEEYLSLLSEKIKYDKWLDEKDSNEYISEFDDKAAYEMLLDEYLNEKIDYGNIHLVPSSKDYVKKLKKTKSENNY